MGGARDCGFCGSLGQLSFRLTGRISLPSHAILWRCCDINIVSLFKNHKPRIFSLSCNLELINGDGQVFQIVVNILHAALRDLEIRVASIDDRKWYVCCKNVFDLDTGALPSRNWHVVTVLTSIASPCWHSVTTRLLAAGWHISELCAWCYQFHQSLSFMRMKEIIVCSWSLLVNLILIVTSAMTSV